MAQGPDLFVVCKNCRAEVSPYITECPYCGHRLRKRAPKLEKGGTPKPPKKKRRPPKPSLGRLKPGEIPGLRADGRPYVTMGFVLVSALFTVLIRSAVVDDLTIEVLSGDPNDWLRAIARVFFYGSTGYELAALAAIFLFGWLLERRHGHWAPALVIVVCSAAGVGVTLLVEDFPIVLGANAAALGLLCAWVVRDLQAVRGREEIEGDLLGVGIIAAILLLLPAAVEFEAHWIAGSVGAVTGLLLGLVLARMPER